jgi:hypothetical protein
MNVTASFLYSGMSDYWGGNGDRWDDNKGCLFAFYGYGTTVRDLIDQWADDFWNGGDCDTLPEGVTNEVVRAALLDMLTDQGRAEYDNNSLCEFAIECAACNGVSAYITPDGPNDDDTIRDRMEDDGCSEEKIEEALGEYLDSPIAIVMIECDVCPDCGKPSGDDTVDELCDECNKEYYGD